MLPFDFLKIVGQTVLESSQDSVLSDVTIRLTPAMADEIWKRWNQCVPDSDLKKAHLETLAQAKYAELDKTIESVERSLGLKSYNELALMLSSYLHLVPSSIRRRFRRPSQPQGLTFPISLSLAEPSDLLTILPPRLARFQPGDRPWAVGEWELEELLEEGTYSETWKGRSLKQEGDPPAWLHFFHQREAVRHLQGAGASLLEQILKRGPMPGVVPLLKVHDQAEPYCVQYGYVEAATLERLVEDWRDQQIMPDPWHVADLVSQIALALGQLHDLRPAIVHRNLRPQNILILPDPVQDWQCLLANLGLGPYCGRISAGKAFDPYASPEQLRGQAAQPQDDVFALGVLWFQLLMADMTRSRPGGASWRKPLVARGMRQALLELLESCFDDDPGQRPADGNALAEAMTRITIPARNTPLVTLLASGPPKIPEPPIVNSIGMPLVLVPSGKFWCGSPAEEFGRRDNEGPRHLVQIHAVHLGVHPVTQEEFARVMNRPAREANHPVVDVTWHDALLFCQRLTQRPEEKGRRYRLPTEAEWEYACRGGSLAPFAAGFSLDVKQANFAARRGAVLATTPVGAYPPNAFGLADMHGNVWEWCHDWFDPLYYRHSSKTDPTGPITGTFRVVRGGSYRNPDYSCRAACRHALVPDLAFPDVGFRVVMETA